MSSGDCLCSQFTHLTDYKDYPTSQLVYLNELFSFPYLLRVSFSYGSSSLWVAPSSAACWPQTCFYSSGNTQKLQLLSVAATTESGVHLWCGILSWDSLSAPDPCVCTVLVTLGLLTGVLHCSSSQTDLFFMLHRAISSMQFKLIDIIKT